MAEFSGQVLLVGNYVEDQQESMRRFANIFLTELPKRGVPVELIRPEVRFGKYRPTKWFGYVDKLILFPGRLRRRLRELPAKTVTHICDHSNAVYTKALANSQHLVTCHDLLAVRSALGEFPENPTRASGRRYQQMILRGLNRARRVVCVSRNTLSDVQRLTSLGPERTTVIYNGLNFPYAPMPRAEAIELITRKRGAPPGRFIVHVGGNQWYKNRLGAVRIYRELLRLRPGAPDLILIGKPWPGVLREQMNDPALAKKVHAALECDNDELRAFYSAADALLFPSLVEGFGWPIVEAQACGCPAATSNRPPMTEVGGDSAVYFNPTDFPMAARQLHTLLVEPPSERARRIQRGLENAARFSAAQMIDRYLEEYSRLLA